MSERLGGYTGQLRLTCVVALGVYVGLRAAGTITLPRIA